MAVDVDVCMLSYGHWFVSNSQGAAPLVTPHVEVERTLHVLARGRAYFLLFIHGALLLSTALSTTRAVYN